MRTQVGRRLKAELLCPPGGACAGIPLLARCAIGTHTVGPATPPSAPVAARSKEPLNVDPLVPFGTVTKVMHERLKPLKLILGPCTLPREATEKHANSPTSHHGSPAQRPPADCVSRGGLGD